METYLAIAFVIATEIGVFLTLYILNCRRLSRLPFGKLRVKLFRKLLMRTGSTKWRLFYARVIFGESPLADWVDRRVASDRELEHRIRIGAHLMHVDDDDIAAISGKACRRKIFGVLEKKTLADCIEKRVETIPLSYNGK